MWFRKIFEPVGQQSKLSGVFTAKIIQYLQIITLLPFFIEMLQYDWLWSGHMIKKEILYIPIKLKPARASMTMSRGVAAYTLSRHGVYIGSLKIIGK